jgi:hypothetical protein
MEGAVDADGARVGELDLPPLARGVGAEVEGVRARVGEGAVEDAVVVDEPDRVAGCDGQQIRGEARRAVAQLRAGVRRVGGRRLGRLEIDERARQVGPGEAFAVHDQAPAQRRGQRRRLGRRRSLGPADAAERQAGDRGEHPPRRKGRSGSCGGAAHPP